MPLMPSAILSAPHLRWPLFNRSCLAGFQRPVTVFPNATSIATLLDKLTHHADVTMIEGESYRVHESQKEAAARRKKR